MSVGSSAGSRLPAGLAVGSVFGVVPEEGCCPLQAARMTAAMLAVPGPAVSALAPIYKRRCFSPGGRKFAILAARTRRDTMKIQALRAESCKNLLAKLATI